jgi:hypothetical protein
MENRGQIAEAIAHVVITKLMERKTKIFLEVQNFLPHTHKPQRHLLSNGGLTDHTKTHTSNRRFTSLRFWKMELFIRCLYFVSVMMVNQEHIHAVPAKQLARHIILNLSTAAQIKLNPMAAWQASK